MGARPMGSAPDGDREGRRASGWSWRRLTRSAGYAADSRHDARRMSVEDDRGGGIQAIMKRLAEAG